MKTIHYLFSVLGALCSVPAFSVGTYYTGSYRSPQTNYQQGTYRQASTGSYYNTNAQAAYYQKWGQPGAVGTQATQEQRQSSGQSSISATKQGFYLGGGVSHETANWDFSMRENGSHLHYDNVSWNVFDANAGYNFNGFKIDGGVKIGTQFGDSAMIDDDITKGGYYLGYCDDKNQNSICDDGDEFAIGRSLSIGKSSGGSMFGFNIGVGLTDKLGFGKVKLTPSAGYRMMSYSLETNSNHGISFDGAKCYSEGGETQCAPLIAIGDAFPTFADPVLANGVYVYNVPAGSMDTFNTLYYSQSGTTHKYDVSWNGPYVALDLDYEIDRNNAVNARVELGLPAYSATGDQPYRIDWAHPKSIKDEAGFGDAYHFGLVMNYATALTGTVMLSFGLTYDYYTMSGAKATTYQNYGYYYSMAEQGVLDAGTSATDPGYATAVKNLLTNYFAEIGCDANGVCTQNNEVDSFYKSMGIRVGLNAKF